MAGPLIPAIIAGAGAVAGGGAGIIGDIISTNKQIDYNKKEAERNRQFQERMSNTAVQRAKADYERAGLSPAMMFASGTQASTPAGNASSITRPNYGASMQNAINSMMNFMLQNKKIDTLNEMNEDRLQAYNNMNNARLMNNTAMHNDRMSLLDEMHESKLAHQREMQHLEHMYRKQHMSNDYKYQTQFWDYTNRYTKMFKFGHPNYED